MDIGDLFQAAFVIIIILGSIFGTVIERWTKKKREEERKRRLEERRLGGETVEEEPLAEDEPLVGQAKLPYEELAEEFFGGYIEQRKKEHEEKTRKRIPVSKPVDDMVIIEEAEEPPPYQPPPPPAEESHLEGVHSHFDNDAWARRARAGEDAHRHGLAVEQLIFKGRRVHPVAKGIIYSEIFGPPHSKRRGRRR